MIDFDQIDKTIHEKARLSIMTLLSSRGEWSFQDLKSELGMSELPDCTFGEALA